MSNQQIGTPFGDPSLSQRYTSSTFANSNIQGNSSGNSGSFNTTIFGNTYNNYYNRDGANSAPNYAEVLRCLYTSGYESHRSRIREPVKGTCTWVTEHPKYKDWLGKKTSGLLWLSADPGYGKSVTASFLINHLKMRTDAIVCYFFFKDDNDEQRSATFALCAILHQLFVQRSTLYEYAAEELKVKGERFTGEVETLWKILVKAVTEGECGNVICVVDALDECEDGTRAQLIRHMTQLSGSQPSHTPLKFLVTSRPYHEIAIVLGTPAATIRLKGEDEVNAISTDVSRVIDEGINDLELYWRQPGGLGYLRNLLECSADRTFLWVSLVLEILKGSEDDSREEFTNIVSTAPRDLTELYARILNKSKKPDAARRILHIVVAASRPLTLCEINVAFRIRRDHSSIRDLGDLSSECETAVRNLCGLFVRIIDSKVYLVHQTAKEFLVKGMLPGQGSWQYTLCSVDSNFILADICITYLSLQDFENDPPVMDLLDTPEDTRRHALLDHIQKYARKYVLLEYAATHWAGHFRDSQNRQMELFELTRPICKRGSNRFLTWLAVYWGKNCEYDPFPNDFTHLMIALWLGQPAVVQRLVKEREDINALSEGYGTALNVAAFKEEEGIVRMLVERGALAYVGGKEYKISLTWRRELPRVEVELEAASRWEAARAAELEEREHERRELVSYSYSLYELEAVSYSYASRWERERAVIEQDQELFWNKAIADIRFSGYCSGWRCGLEIMSIVQARG